MLMGGIESILRFYAGDKIALYGLGTETERFITEYRKHFSIVGILDGFKYDGEIYGYPIIPLISLPSKKVSLIVVVARPGSCKAITKRIGKFCEENKIALYDVRGRNLLASTSVKYDFKTTSGTSRNKLYEIIESSDVISFDLFDTLVMRKTKSYVDLFDLMELRLRDMGIYIPDFAKLRLHVEKDLSRIVSPRLEQIYERLLVVVGGNFITASELAEMEWDMDFNLFIVRDEVREVFCSVVSNGKRVVITTDSYYSRKQIEKILIRFGLTGYNELFVSCEYGTAKTQDLYNFLKKAYPGRSILHIGDDEYADFEKAKCNGLKAYRLYSASDLCDELGGLGIEEFQSISDRVKIGLFMAHAFNSPFWFEDDDRRFSVRESYEIGFLFCAPMITDYVHWMKESIEKQAFAQVLFGSRDGYLMGRLYRMIDNTRKVVYFLISRTAAIRMGMCTESDIEYVDSMKYSGKQEEALSVRFGIDAGDIEKVDRTAIILEKSRKQRDNYYIYIEKLGLKGKKGRQICSDEHCVKEERLAWFDFVAKGTTQLYLQRLFPCHIKGFYFLKLEPEFMEGRCLDIEPFYSDEEKNTSVIFDNYYILETILTSPYPQMLEMGDNGIPVFADETRSEADIEVVKRMQAGIEEYFKDYISILPESARTVNKKLDEKMLELVNKVHILDEDFLKLKVEDLFFGRMTDITDVIG
ncbi:hypothetical protein SAMN06296386_11033 [Lachnospiraceae bacterium]|nr:hypothetical protein SAMN06296386_11033 [Lachnospiraceae bacterium]